jgi:hypothetical protein
MPAPVRSLSEGAKSLVERSRAGDQNAMATIAAIRQRAIFGKDLVALTSMKLIKNYLDEHPVGQMGADPRPPSAEVLSYVHPDVPEWLPVCLSECLKSKDGYHSVVVRLANIRPLTGEDLPRVAHVLGPEHASMVMAGATKQKMDPRVDRAARLAFMVGACFGSAMALQAIREGAAPISLLSPEAGWELGE